MCDKTLTEAFALAERLHGGQFDKAGQPYFTHHVVPVHDLVNDWGGDTHQRVIAILHDTVEDTGITLDDLRDKGYCDRIVYGVDGVTRRDGEPYLNFIVRAAQEPDSRLVKMADNRHNYHGLGNLPADVAARLRRRYERAWEFLRGAG